MFYLLRLELPDRPGSLGLVATALGEAGVDIISLDIVEKAGGGVVDDFVVELPDGGYPDRLITICQALDGVHVESVRPYHSGYDVHRELELVEELATSPASAREALARAAPRIFRAGWALVVSMGVTGPVVEAVSPSAPESLTCPLPWLPLAGPRRLDPEADWVPSSWQTLGTVLAAAPLGVPSRAILIGRPGGPEFRDSEVLRLGHLSGIAASVTDHRPTEAELA